MFEHHRVLIGLAIAGLTAGVSANQAEICYSTPVPFNQAVPPTNSTVFHCPITGARTIPQVAAAGWEVVQLGPLVEGGSNQTDQLVIQKRN